MTNTLSKNKITAFTIISVIVLSLIPSLGIFAQDIYFTFWFPILVLVNILILYSIDFGYRRYLLIIFLSLIGSTGVTILFVGSAYGYILIFLFLNFKNIFISSLAAYILTIVVKRISNKDLLKKQNLPRVYMSIFVVSLLSLGVVIYNDQDTQTLLFDEVHKKVKLAKSVVKHVLENEEALMGEFNLFESGLYKGIYETSHGKVIHNFGGEVSVEFVENEILMTYRDFPNEEDCFQFFYVNDLRYDGFKRTLVNGTEFIWISNTVDINRNKKSTCYKGDEKVTIVFKGTLADFKESLRFK